MSLSPDLLQAAGILLFGEQWRKPLARALQVNERTVGRWANGDFNIAKGIGRELVDLIQARKIEADQLIERLTASR